MGKIREGIVGAAVLGACLVGFAGTAEAAGVPGLEPGRRGDLVEMRVSYVMDTVRLRAGAAGWTLVPGNLPAEPETIKRVVGRFFALHANEKVGSPGSDEEALVPWRLNLEEARFVELRFGSGAPVRLRLGFSPEDQATYWKLEDGRDVYRVCNLAWAVPYEMKAWVRVALFPDLKHPRDVRAIAMEWRDSLGQRRSYELRRSEDASTSWVIAAGDTSKVHPYREDVFLQALQFMTEGLPVKAVPRNAPDPGTAITLTGRDGVARVLRPLAVEGPSYVVNYPGTSTPVRLARGRLDAFRRSPETFTLGPALGPRPDDGTRPPKTFPGYGVLLPAEHKDHEDPDFVDPGICVEGSAPAAAPAPSRGQGAHDGHPGHDHAH